MDSSELPKNTTETSTTKPRGRPFAKGNPGRPPGSRNKTSVALEAMRDGEAEAIASKAVELALAGDRFALRLCLDRILAPRPDRSVSFEMPALKSASDGAAALSAVVAAVASGEITPGEGVSVSQIIGTAVRAFEARDFEQRIEAVERAKGNSK
jgi:hypothetical protein